MFRLIFQRKSAGREGRNFALTFDDQNLSIRKRRFLTATPCHYNPHDRDRKSEARLLFSMDIHPAPVERKLKQENSSIRCC